MKGLVKRQETQNLKHIGWTSLMVQWLRLPSIAEDVGSMPSRGVKIPRLAAKTPKHKAETIV